eukprot:1526400-Prymnesium_polylepis.1
METSHSIRNAPTRPHALHPDSSRTAPATRWRVRSGELGSVVVRPPDKRQRLGSEASRVRAGAAGTRDSTWVLAGRRRR